MDDESTGSGGATAVADGMRDLGRLAACGWRLPPRADDGVFYFRSTNGERISYPEEGFEVLGVNGGAGYWFDHRAAVVSSYLKRLRVTSLLEVGAGTGAMAARLQPVLESVITVEPLVAGARSSARLGLTSLCATLEELRLPTGCIEAVGAFDVLEHLEDPAVLLTEARRVMKPGGLFVVTVPAFSALWGDEDDVAQHYRRYAKRTLGKEVERAGFETLHMEYLYALLVPIAALVRALPYRLGRRRPKEAVLLRMKSQLDVPRVVDRAMGGLFAMETSIARLMPMPVGLTLFAAFRAVK